MNKVTSVVFSGIGGLGVVTAAGICAQAALLSGFDVKKADIKGIAKRGGAVLSSVRFGERVNSPRVEESTADYLVNIGSSEKALPFLSDTGLLIDIHRDLAARHGRHANLYALGILSSNLCLELDTWFEAIGNRFSQSARIANIESFLVGRRSWTQAGTAV